jgi:hypothetical protein
MNRQIELLENMIRCTIAWRDDLKAMKAKGFCAGSTMIDDLLEIAETRISRDRALVQSIRSEHVRSGNSVTDANQSPANVVALRPSA